MVVPLSNRLTCKAKGHPQPTVYWAREDKGKTITQWDIASGEKKEGISKFRDLDILYIKAQEV
jgi:hypothetical protein